MALLRYRAFDVVVFSVVVVVFAGYRSGLSFMGWTALACLIGVLNIAAFELLIPRLLTSFSEDNQGASLGYGGLFLLRGAAVVAGLVWVMYMSSPTAALIGVGAIALGLSLGSIVRLFISSEADSDEEVEDA